MTNKKTNKHKSKRFRKVHIGEVKVSKKMDVTVKDASINPKSGHRQLRGDLTKIFVLTMLAVGLEVALKLLWR